MWDGLLHRNTFRGKCKTALSRSNTRLEVIKKKRNAMQKFLKKDIADLLKNNLDRNAYGRAEGLYNELNLTSCYDFVEQCCACVSEHLKQMHKERECPEECSVAVSSLVYAAARFADLPELRDLRNQFNEKYGKSLEPFVSKEFVEKLKPKPPTMEMKLQLMQEITQEFSIIWDSLPLQQQLHNQGIDKSTNLGPGVAASERIMSRSRSNIGQSKSKQEDGISRLMNEDQKNNPKTRRHNSFSESKKADPEMLQDEKRQSCLRNESENNPCRKPFTNKIVSAPYVISSNERKSDTAPEDISSKNKEDNDPNLLSKAAKPRPKSVRTKFLNKSVSSATGNSEHGTGIAEREIRSARVPQHRTGNVFSDEEDETDVSGSFGRNRMSFCRSPEVPGTPKSTLPPPPGQRRYLFADSQTNSPGRDSDGQTGSDTPSSSGRSKFLPPDYPQPDSPTETDISPSMRHVKSDSLISDAGVIKHVHPKMPSFDELAERVAALRNI